MLTLRVINTTEGTEEEAKYCYFVFVNGKEIARGDVEGHNRKDGWADLVKMIAEHELNKGEYDLSMLKG